MDKPSGSEADLLRASRSGDTQAFAHLVDRYKGLVGALTYSGTCDLPLSHDLAQETFAVAWRKLDGLLEPGKFRAWLCGIARHLVQQALRDRRRDPLHAAQPLEALAERATPLPTPCDAAVLRERVAIVGEALARLPEEYRLPLVLYYFEGRSTRAVAEALGITEEAARQRLVRGRQRLREHVFAVVGDTLEHARPNRIFVLTVLGRIAKLPAPIVGAGKGVSAWAGAAKAAFAGTTAVAVLVIAWQTYRIPASPAPVTETAPPATAAASDVPETGMRPAAPPALVAVPAAAPQESQPTDEEAARLATSILNRAWVVQPIKAVRGICVEAWGYRAALGDTQSRDRLVAEVLTLGEDAIRANQMLQAVLYDTGYMEEVYARCLNRSLSDSIRTAHISTLFFGKPLPGAAPPPDVVEAAVSLAERLGPVHSTMRFLEETATEAARPVTEYYLLASAYGPTTATGQAVRTSTPGFRAVDTSQAGLLSGICLEAACLEILGRIGNPESCEAIHRYLDAGAHVDTPLAAYTLCRLGDAEAGLPLLRSCVNRAEGPLQRIRCATLLAEAGEDEGIRVLQASMRDTDTDIRVKAYGALCRLGDTSFIEPLLRDLANVDRGSFSAIYLSDQESIQTTEGGLRLVGSPAFLEFCARTAELPDVRTASTPHSGALLILALSSLHDAPPEYARRALPACMTALDVPAHAVGRMDVAAQNVQAQRIAFLIHWGDEATRCRAGDCLLDACTQVPLFQDEAAFCLKWAGNREAEPALQYMMQSCPRENIRILAALAYLAVHSGRRSM